MAMYRQAGKRLCDVVAGTLLMIGAAPVLVGAALAVRFALGRPVFWRQLRPGLNGQPFWMIKLRTMTTATDPLGHLLPDEQRMTRIGRLLRNSSIDELPELWNVVKGDMSLVGPRPLPVRDVSRIDVRAHKRRMSVQPGITCLWQIDGREPEFDNWIRTDMQYIDNWSLSLDVKILLKTIPAVLSGHGAY